MLISSAYFVRGSLVELISSAYFVRGSFSANFVRGLLEMEQAAIEGGLAHTWVVFQREVVILERFAVGAGSGMSQTSIEENLGLNGFACSFTRGADANIKCL